MPPLKPPCWSDDAPQADLVVRRESLQVIEAHIRTLLTLVLDGYDLRELSAVLFAGNVAESKAQTRWTGRVHCSAPLPRRSSNPETSLPETGTV